MRDLRLNRRDIRDFTGWTDTRLRIHLQRLVDMEYLLLYRAERSKTFVYELIYKGEGGDGSRFVMQLIDTEKLKKQQYDSQSAGQNVLSADHPQGSSIPSAARPQSSKSAVTPSKPMTKSKAPAGSTEKALISGE